MFFKSRPAKHNKRSRKSRFSNNFSIESLERREMFAANLGTELTSQLAATTSLDSPPAAVTAATAPLASGPAAGASRAGADGVLTPPNRPAPGGVVVPAPSLNAKFENGVLNIAGSNDADNILIYASEGTVYVREVVKETTLLTVSLAQLKSIVVNANGGDDWISVDEESINVSATINGGAGNDTLMGGAAGDILDGGSGKDRLLGHGGNDSLTGGYGHDLIVGGNGHDALYGNEGNDFLFGGAGDDLLIGETGDDSLYGEDGNDLLIGGAGRNFLDGGAGNDTIYGGDENDDISGGDGNDIIFAGAGDDLIRGGAGKDNISAGDGSDMVDGGDGNDLVRGEGGNDALSGGAGIDVIYGGTGLDWISGGDGNDSLYGEAGKDWLEGGLGIDLLDGGGSNDTKYQDSPPANSPDFVYSGNDAFDQLAELLDEADGDEPTGQVAQASWFSEAVDTVGDALSDIAEWTWDRAVNIARLVREWVIRLPDRFVRLGEDLADTFSNWPWEEKFWQGMGHVLTDVVEITPLGEVIEILCSLFVPDQRGMTAAEKKVARSVFGDSVDWGMVRFNEHSLTIPSNVDAFVTGYIVNSKGNMSDALMMHELTHVWQYVQDGLIYMPEALNAQDSLEGYDYANGAGEDEWEKKSDALEEAKDAGKKFRDFNREQQGEIVSDFFRLRKIILDASAGDSVSNEKGWLDAYIPFVRVVSTLTDHQLRGHGTAGTGSGSLPGNSDNGPGSPNDGPPTDASSNPASSPARDAVFGQLVTAPAVKSAAASSLLLTRPIAPAAGGNSTEPSTTIASKGNSSQPAMAKPASTLNTSPITARAVDTVFGSLGGKSIR